MVPVALSDVIAVGEVPTAGEIEILAAAGFRSLLNTQPDGEVERLLPSADAKVLAETAGLTYQHLPIPSRRPDKASLDAFAKALGTLPRPIYACCYSGARTAAAWALAAGRTEEPDAVIAACAAAGYDIGFLKPQMVEARTEWASGLASGLAPLPVIPVVVINGHAHANGAALPTDTPPVPRLTPSILAPRAASVGGFAVAG